MTAAEVFVRMLKAYADLRSYRDEGVVKTTFFNLSRTVRRETEVKPFKTIFVRNKVFKYEYERKKKNFPRHRYLVYSDFKLAKSHWELNGKTRTGELDALLATAAGVSSGSSRRIPRMLLGGNIATRALDFEGAEIARTKAVDGFQCYEIPVPEINKNKATYWVDSKLFILRKMMVDTDFDKEILEGIKKEAEKSLKKRGRKVPEFREFSTRAITIYKPKVGIKIDSSKILFDPN